MTRGLLVALGVALVAAALALPASADGPLQGRIVALDPGHGETATEMGTSNTINGVTVYERDVNWTVVVATRAKLEALGATVVLTRDQYEYVDRPTRYQRANDAGAEVLLSVHHNGSSDPTINYTITYYTQKSDQKIATLAQQNLVQYLGFSDHGTRRDGFGMTVRPRMPSALTEAWFLTNDALAERYLYEQSQGHPSGSLVDLEASGAAEAVLEYLTASTDNPHGKPGSK